MHFISFLSTEMAHLHHVCWCPGDARSQAISNHGIGIVIQVYSGLSTITPDWLPTSLLANPTTCYKTAISELRSLWRGSLSNSNPMLCDFISSIVSMISAICLPCNSISLSVIHFFLLSPLPSLFIFLSLSSRDTEISWIDRITL